MTRKRISFTFDPRDKLSSLHIGLSFVRATVVCSILERTPGFEPSSETIAPRYLNNETCHFSKLLSFNLDLSLDAIGAVCHKYCLFSTYLHFIPCAGLDHGLAPVNTGFFKSVFRCTGLHTSCHVPVNNYCVSILQMSPAHYW